MTKSSNGSTRNTPIGVSRWMGSGGVSEEGMMGELGILLLVLVGLVALRTSQDWSEVTVGALKSEIVGVGIAAVLVGINALYPIPYVQPVAAVLLMAVSIALVIIVLKRL